MIDPHAILGLSPGASEKEIKSAFRKLAKQHHPDAGGDEAKFKEINEAYAILTGKQEQPQPNFGDSGSFDPFSTFFDQNIFDAIFRQQRGGRVINRVTIDPLILIQGGMFEYAFQQYENRNGRLHPIRKATTIRVEADSPAGIQIVVPNTHPNHIILQLFPGNTERFQVHEMLHLTEVQNIDVFRAMIGGDHEVTTPMGKKVVVKIPPGTQSGNIHRMRMAGLKSPNGTRGDYNLQFIVDIPAVTDEVTKTKIMEFMKKE